MTCRPRLSEGPSSAARSRAQRRHERELRWFLGSCGAAATGVAARRAALRSARIEPAWGRLPIEVRQMLQAAYGPPSTPKAGYGRLLGIAAGAAHCSAAVISLGGDAALAALISTTRRKSLSPGGSILRVRALDGIRQAIVDEIRTALVAYGRAARAHALRGRALRRPPAQPRSLPWLAPTS